MKALKDNKIEHVNLGFDEKALSDCLEITTLNDSGEITFSIKGCADYIWPSINEDLDKVKKNLKDFSNTANLVVENGDYLIKNITNLSDLYVNLKDTRLKTSSFLKKLMNKSRKNSISIARETVKLANIDACLSRTQYIITKSINIFLSRTLEVEQINVEEPLLINREIGNETLPDLDIIFNESSSIKLPISLLSPTSKTKFINKTNLVKKSNKKSNNKLLLPTELVCELTAADKFKDMKPAWNRLYSLKLGNSATYDQSVIFLATSLKLQNKNLNISEIFSTYNSSSFNWVIHNSSSITNGDGIPEYLHIHLEGELVSSSIINIICQMNIFNETSAFVTLNHEKTTSIFFIKYNSYVKDTFKIIISALQDVQFGKAKKTPETSKYLQSIVSKDLLDKKLIFSIPDDSLHNKVDTSSDGIKIIPDLDIDIKLELSSLRMQSLEVIKSSSLCLLKPANHILAFVANSVFGKNKGQISDIPVAYCLTGKGYKVNTEVRKVLNNVIAVLEKYNIKVLSISADTAFHQILLKPWSQNSFDEYVEENGGKNYGDLINFS